MKTLTILLIAFATMFAIACGSDGQETPAPEPTPDQTLAAAQGAATQASEPAATAAPASAPAAPTAAPATRSQAASAQESSGEPLSGGVFRRLWSDPPTLDPHLSSDTTSAGIVVEIYSGLVALDTDLQLIPDIADRWEIDSTGTVYTFHIRDNAKFHDGKPVTASDFKWSMERAVHPDTASPVADTYLNDIVGVEAALEGETTDISGVKVIDDSTLQITIDAPKAYFLAKLTYPTAYVLDRENVESGGRTWTDAPNGTGPFVLKEYRIGERIILERNENFYREPAHLDSIAMNLAGGQSMAMYENDEIDITGVGLFDLDRVLDPDEELNKELVVAPPDFSVSYVGFNTNEPPFDDPKFRQALNHAVDKELIAAEVLSDLVEPAYGILPPGFPGYSDNFRLKDADGAENPNFAGLSYDPELARQLLAESKYPDADTRPRIVITVPGTGGTIGLDLEVVIEMWKQELGVEVEIQQVEWATYLQDLNQNKFQAYGGLGWSADYPDPQDFLDILFHTDSSINHGAYSNPDADAILEDARVEADIERRIELYHQAEEIIVQDAAWLPLWYSGERYVLIKRHVKDYRVTPMIVPKLKNIRFTDS